MSANGPGSVVSSIEDGGRNGLAVVLATSRHKRTFSLDDACVILVREVVGYSFPVWESREDYDRAAKVARRFVAQQHPYRWRSVTAAEMDLLDGEHCCEADGEHPWCTEGRGKAWMDVISCPTGVVEDAIRREVLGEEVPA